MDLFAWQAVILGCVALGMAVAVAVHRAADSYTTRAIGFTGWHSSCWLAAMRCELLATGTTPTGTQPDHFGAFRWGCHPPESLASSGG